MECQVYTDECIEADEDSLGSATKLSVLRLSDTLSTSSDSEDTSGDQSTDAGIDIAKHINSATEMELLAATKDAAAAFYLFLNDKPDEAMQMIKSKSEKSMYHSVSLGAMYCLKAVLTFDPTTIAEAMDVLKKTVDVCNERRRSYTLTNNALTRMVIRPNYDDYTEEEIHAELCYCECLLMRAFLSFAHDTGILSLIKGGLKIRRGYQIYKDCMDILQYRTWSNAQLRGHFESGVNMGIGCFNLVLSSVPTRILKILEFIGFSGDRDYALERLSEGQKRHDSLRGPFCSLILIGYHLIARYALGSPRDPEALIYAEKLLQPLVAASPKGVGIQYLLARLDHVKGNVQGSIDRMQRTLEGRADNNKFHHVAAWEIAWCYCTIGEWRKAIQNLDILWKESLWSRCTYAYAKASALLMCDDITDEERQEIVGLMIKAPTYMQQVIGRAVPVEKYFCNRAERFLKQDNWLVLPIYEMMYLWNLFFILQDKNDILTPIVARIDVAIQELQEERFQASPWCVDNYCLAIFLKGLCLRYMGALDLAEELFLEVTKNEENIVEDTQVISFAYMELGFMYQEERDYDRAVKYLTAARTYSIFLTEFRIHSAIEEIRRTGFHDVLMDKDPGARSDFF